MKKLEIDKVGSATAPLGLGRSVSVVSSCAFPAAGDVVAVRALSESSTYGNLELPTGRLAKINRGDLLLGVLGRRRALKGFVGDVPTSIKQGDRLHLLNMGGLIGVCTGHHSALSDAIEVEVAGLACDEDLNILNIAERALPPAEHLDLSAPIVLVAGTCMNSGKTVAAVELIRQAASRGLRVAGAKLTGVACLRDTLNMEDHGAVVSASFLDCGLPSTVGYERLPQAAKGLLNHLNGRSPDMIVAELGDGVVGEYGVDLLLADQELRSAISALVFCASDYAGVIGGLAVLDDLGIRPDVISGSVTDSIMGEEFIESRFGIAAGNARRGGERLFDLISKKITPAMAAV
jgi:hypothetical protein